MRGQRQTPFPHLAAYLACQIKYKRIQFSLRIAGSYLSMNRVQRNNTEILSERYPNYNMQYNKSPIRRQNGNGINPGRSPIRSRTPTRHVSPIKNNSQQFPIRFISNVSPSKDRPPNQQNYLEFSNGKTIKYINHNLNDKNYQSKKFQLSKKTDRNTQEDNRLFGKLVHKLNSEKKSGLKSNENSYKTSVFADNSDNKPTRMEQTTGKPEGGAFKQLFQQARVAQTKKQATSTSKPKDNSVDKGEGLSCLVYKIKANLNGQKEELRQKKNSIQRTKDTGFVNTPSILLKRKHSKLEQEQRIGNSPALKKQPSERRDEEEEDYTEFDNLLARVDQNKSNEAKRPVEEVVKMSMRVDQSLNMDPFM